MPTGRSTLDALWSRCASVFTVGTPPKGTSPRIVVGPFEIEIMPTKIGAGGFPNTTANPFLRTTISMFRIRYRGKPVAIVDGSNKIDEFAEARVLDTAPQPTLLAAHAGIYLLHEAQGELVTAILAPASNDPARWQWLDGIDGQPAPEDSPRPRDASGETLREHGGRLLLVNRRNVLDLATWQQYPIAVNATEAMQAMGGYNAGNDVARALSPGRTAYVASAVAA